MRISIWKILAQFSSFQYYFSAQFRNLPLPFSNSVPAKTSNNTLSKRALFWTKQLLNIDFFTYFRCSGLLLTTFQPRISRATSSLIVRQVQRRSGVRSMLKYQQRRKRSSIYNPTAIISSISPWRVRSGGVAFEAQPHLSIQSNIIIIYGLLELIEVTPFLSWPLTS